jgi:hypothetical protein
MDTGGIELNLYGLKTGTVSNGSRISVGKQMQIRKFNTIKKNQGFGQQFGDDASIAFPKSVIHDQDCSDAEARKWT